MGYSQQAKNASNKARVQILTVDPANRRIEGLFKDNSTIQIVLWDNVTSAFRMPAEGEIWMVTRVDNVWHLDRRVQQGTVAANTVSGQVAHLGSVEALPITSLSPGQLKLDAMNIVDGAGTRLLATSALSVKAYGAMGDGVTDDTAALQAALNAAGAGVAVTFPVGVYMLSSPLFLKAMQIVEGAGAQLWWEQGSGPAENVTPRDPTARMTNPCRLSAMSSFTGAGLLIADDSSGGAPIWGGRIRRLGIQGNRVGTNVHGLILQGQATDWHLEDVEAADCSGDGLHFASVTRSGASFNPQNMTMFRCFAHNNHGNGVTAAPIFDSTILNCWAHENDGEGWSFRSGCHWTEVIGCKAEFNGDAGFFVQGAVGDRTELTFANCRTDMNEFWGVRLVNQGGIMPITLDHCILHRDGRNGGSGGGEFAALRIEGSSAFPHGPVRVIGLKTVPGNNDNATGTEHPQHPVSIQYPTVVTIDGDLWGAGPGAWVHRPDGGGVGQVRITETSTYLTGSWTAGTVTTYNPIVISDTTGAGIAFSVGAGGFTPAGSAVPTFAASWGNAASATMPAFFYKDSLNVVHIEGHVTPTASVTAGSIIFTLPPEFAPSKQVWFTEPGTTASVSILVDSSGNVTWEGAALTAGAFVPLYGLRFMKR